MKKVTLLFILIAFGLVSLQAQSLYNYLGEGERNEKDLRKIGSFAIPQMRVGFETYSIKTLFVQEGEISAMLNKLETIGTNKHYQKQGSLLKASAILSSDISKEDFQQLTEEFQTIMEDAIEAAGLKIHRLTELPTIKEYKALEEKFDKKTTKLNEKTDESELGNQIVYFVPENGLMMYDGASIGWSVPTITKAKKMVTKNDVLLLLNNIEVDFSLILLEGSVEGGWNRNSGADFKNTKAKVEILPVMNIKDVKLNIIGSAGSPSPTPIVLKETYASEKSYEATLYQDAKESESLLAKMFAIKRRPDVEFDPMIVEVSREVYMDAARALFKQYSADFAATLRYASMNKK